MTKHTDECLRYAAKTGQPFCIASCTDEREAEQLVLDVIAKKYPVLAEQIRQAKKWGMQDMQEHPDEWWLPILVEEVGEVGKAMLEDHFDYPDAVLEDVRTELIETAAVAMSWIMCIDRRADA